MTHLLQVRIEDEQWQQIQDAAAKDRRSVASWVRLLIEDRLQQPLIYDMTYSPKTTIYSGNPQHQASEVQTAERSAPTREAAGSTPARRAGKGSPAANRSSQAANETGTNTSSVRNPAESPSRKPKACKHTNQIRKLGRPYCTDCGEFV